jgi:hypothetical protein
MAMYLCRWPNGEFSIVNARTKSEAVELLDEWGNAEQATLTRMGDCMIDFRLNDSGEIELANIGEVTDECIMEICYPELDNAFATAEWDESGSDYSAAGHAQIRAAVELERNRLFDTSSHNAEASHNCHLDWSLGCDCDGACHVSYRTGE